MFDDDNTDDLFFCPDCHEYAVVGADHCDDCHEGRCAICGELIAKGTPHAAGSSSDLFCGPCDTLAAEESAGEIAERLGNAVPESVDDEAETERLEHEPMRLWAWGGRFAAVAALALACISGLACAGKAPVAEQVETVGTLAPSYNSVAVAPLHHDAPPELGFVAGSDDDSVGEVATTVSRADAGDGDAAPEVVGKGGGLVVGGGQ